MMGDGQETFWFVRPKATIKREGLGDPESISGAGDQHHDMDPSQIDSIATQFKVHNTGVNSPLFVIPFLAAGRQVHVQSHIWRGVTLPQGSIVLGSVFYVGETDNTDEKGPWRPQQKGFFSHSPQKFYLCLMVFLMGVFREMV